MDEQRKEKIEERIKEIIASFIERESNKTALITITRIELLEKGRAANIMLSVLPETGEDSALNFLKRKRPEMKTALKNGLNMRTIPFLDVLIDKGEKARNNIEALLKEDTR